MHFRGRWIGNSIYNPTISQNMECTIFKEYGIKNVNISFDLEEREKRTKRLRNKRDHLTPLYLISQ